jgi:predicted nucleic acid-binding protein
VSITAEIQGVASHPEDDVILATAINGGAEFLVTGGRKLQILGFYQGVRILCSRDFLELLDSQAEGTPQP